MNFQFFWKVHMQFNEFLIKKDTIFHWIARVLKDIKGE